MYCFIICCRFSGSEFPPVILFKIFTHTEGTGLKYLSGKRCIKPATSVSKVEDIIPFTLETQMHTAGPSCMAHFIAHDVACIASPIYVMVMHEFGPVFCISVFFEKRIMKLTLSTYKFIPFLKKSTLRYIVGGRSTDEKK